MLKITLWIQLIKKIKNLWLDIKNKLYSCNQIIKYAYNLSLLNIINGFIT